VSVWALLLSVAAAGQAAMPPEPIDQANWIRIQDYPSEAMLNGWEGKTGFMLSVDATGSAKGCTITVSSGHPLLDRATCDLMLSRSRFRPATNARGAAVAGQFAKEMEWQIPNDPSMSWAVVRVTGAGPECVVDKVTRMEAETCRSLVEAMGKAGVTLPARVQIGKRAPEPN
jgi:TonB family protein